MFFLPLLSGLVTAATTTTLGTLTAAATTTAVGHGVAKKLATSINADIGGVVIKDVATKAGEAIDYCTGGTSNFAEYGRIFDEVTKDVTIKFDFKQEE